MITILTLFACTEGGSVWLDDTATPTAPVPDFSQPPGTEGGTIEIPLAEEGDRILLTVAVEPGTELGGWAFFGAGPADPIFFDAMNTDLELNLVDEFDAEVYLISEPLSQRQADGFASVQDWDGEGATETVTWYGARELSFFNGMPDLRNDHFQLQISLWAADGDNASIHPITLLNGGTNR